MENKINEVRNEINTIINELNYKDLVKLREMISGWNAKYYTIGQSDNIFSIYKLCYDEIEKIDDLGRIKRISYPVVDLYNDSKSINNMVNLIYEIYSNVIKDTDTIVDVANKISNYELDFEEKINITNRNRFLFKVTAEQVFLKEDLDNINKILELDTNVSDEIKNYIKNSSSNGLIYIHSCNFNVCESWNNINKYFEIPRCVIDYNLFCNSLRKLGMNVYINNENKLSYYKTSTYNQFLNCVLKNDYDVELYISDTRFELDKNGYSIYKTLTDDKKKVLKRR